MSEQNFYNHDFINAYIQTSDNSISSVAIQVHKPTRYDVIKDGQYHSVTLHIDIPRFEELVLAWCKTRSASELNAILSNRGEI